MCAVLRPLTIIRLEVLVALLGHALHARLNVEADEGAGNCRHNAAAHLSRDETLTTDRAGYRGWWGRISRVCELALFQTNWQSFLGCVSNREKYWSHPQPTLPPSSPPPSKQIGSGVYYKTQILTWQLEIRASVIPPPPLLNHVLKPTNVGTRTLKM